MSRPTRVVLIDPSEEQLRAAAGGDVARWVDRQGRTHVRIVPGAEADAVRAVAASSPLAAVYPDVAYRVSAGDGWRWRVVCGCGEAGTAEALAWMGPHCGVCHDRQEEGALAPVVVRQGEVWCDENTQGPVAAADRRRDAPAHVAGQPAAPRRRRGPGDQPRRAEGGRRRPDAPAPVASP